MDAGDDLSFDGVGTPIKPFTEMNAAERKEFWSDEKKLMGFFNKVMPMLEGACCAVCDQSPDSDDDKRCITCGIFFHAKCLGFSDERGTVDASCLACREESPDCLMCLHPNSISPLVRARAAPKSMKKWEADPSSYEESIFKTIKFCHALCGL